LTPDARIARISKQLDWMEADDWNVSEYRWLLVERQQWFDKAMEISRANVELQKEINRLKQCRDVEIDFIKQYKRQVDKLRTLVDGAMEVVEIFHVESPAQSQWKHDWLNKAREAIG
jgi:predicted  nucleic acid-binding Zn-ribbon protein